MKFSRTGFCILENIPAGYKFVSRDTEMNGGKMKRRISKLKNILFKKETGKKALGIILLITVFATSAATTMPVHGEESLQKTVVTEIYHKHIGN